MYSVSLCTSSNCQLFLFKLNFAIIITLFRRFLENITQTTMESASTNWTSTPIDYNNCTDGNDENSDQNNICSSLKILEGIILNMENETNRIERDSYHDVRSDFNNNGIDLDINDSFQYDGTAIGSPLSISPNSPTTSTNCTPPTPQKKFVLLDGVLRKLKKDKKELCVFCKNNGQPDYVYETHRTHDIYGRVVCPHLRIYTCPICKTTGDDAHTVKYCPQKPILTVQDTRQGLTPRRFGMINTPSFSSTSSIIPIPHRRTNAAHSYTKTQNSFQNYRL